MQYVALRRATKCHRRIIQTMNRRFEFPNSLAAKRPPVNGRLKQNASNESIRLQKRVLGAQSP